MRAGSRWTVLAIACVAIGLSGCGGGGEEGPAAPTNDAFITRADKICAQGQVDLQSAVTATFGNQAPTEAEGIEFTTTETVPLLTLQVEALRALTPPEGDQETLDAIWDAMEEGVNTLEENPETALDGSDPMADAMELARSYGFRSCGEESSAPTDDAETELPATGDTAAG